MVSKSGFNSGGLTLFHGRREYVFAFQSDTVKLLLKTSWGDKEYLTLIFLHFEVLQLLVDR